MTRIGLTLSSRQDTSDQDLVAVAREAEALGYDTCWTGESWGRDAFTVLTLLACNTKTLRLGTGIIPVFSRTPGLIAQSIASLDLISQGRAVLGLGTSGRVVIEDWHGVSYRQPLQRTREYLEIIRMALSGNPVNYQGQNFQLQRFRLGLSAVQQHLPIYLASLGPKNLQLTGELADGWLPIWVDQQRLPDLKEEVAEAASAAGRDISQITVAPQILCCVADNSEELAQAEREARSHMAYYIGGMGLYYYNLFCRFGYRREADAVRQAWSEGDRDRAAAAISGQMLENITVLGDAETCRSKLRRFREMGADMPVVAFPHGATKSAILKTLRALAPNSVAEPTTRPAGESGAVGSA